MLETAGSPLQVGLLRADEPYGGIIWDFPLRQSEKLFFVTQLLLEEACLGWRDIQGIVYHQGPGSHTGLRIGLAAVKAWALSLGWKVYAVPLLKVLHAIACMRRPQAQKYLLLWQSRPGEGYGQVWTPSYPVSEVALQPIAHWRAQYPDACIIGNLPEADLPLYEIRWDFVAHAAQMLSPLSSEEVLSLVPLYFRPFIPTQRKV